MTKRLLNNKEILQKLRREQQQLKQPKVDLVDYSQNFKKYNEFLQSSKKVQEYYKGEVKFIENLFPKELCQELIDITTKIGYKDALIQTGVGVGVMNKSVRNSQRVMIDDIQSTNYLFSILKKFVPLCSEGAICTGINERLRFLKYEPGGIFKIHQDGRFGLKPREISLFTTQFYLNKVLKGGNTTFFKSNGRRIDKENDVVSLEPAEGGLAIFRQDGWYHQGDTVLEGLKYTIRSEFMYKYLNNEEINELDSQEKCGVCNIPIQIVPFDRCSHYYLKCNCPSFNPFRYSPLEEPNCYVCRGQTDHY